MYCQNAFQTSYFSLCCHYRYVEMQLAQKMLKAYHTYRQFCVCPYTVQDNAICSSKHPILFYQQTDKQIDTFSIQLTSSKTHFNTTNILDSCIVI